MKTLDEIKAYTSVFKDLTPGELAARLEEVDDLLAREYDFDTEFGPEELWELGIDLRNQRKALQKLIWGNA